MRQTRQAARRKRGGPSSAASAGAGRSPATARAALRRVGPGGPTTPGGIPPERRARRDTPAQAGALPRSLPPADGLKKTAWAGKGARPAWLCRDTCPALAPPPKGGDLPCCAAGAGPCAAATGTPPLPPHAAGRGPGCAKQSFSGVEPLEIATLDLLFSGAADSPAPASPAAARPGALACPCVPGRAALPAHSPAAGQQKRPAPKALACNKVGSVYEKDGSTLSLSQHSAVVKSSRLPSRAAPPPEGDGRGQTPRRSASARKRKGPHTSCGPIPFVRLACACPPSQHVYYTTAPPPLSSVAAVPLLRRCRRRALPSSASPGGGREGASLAPQRMAFPFCRGFLGGAFAGARSVPGKDRRRPPRCRFPHAAGVGVSSRSPVSRVRRAAPRLLLAAVHRAVLHLGRRCSLWQSSTT